MLVYIVFGGLKGMDANMQRVLHSAENSKNIAGHKNNGLI